MWSMWKRLGRSASHTDRLRGRTTLIYRGGLQRFIILYFSCVDLVRKLRLAAAYRLQSAVAHSVVPWLVGLSDLVVFFCFLFCFVFQILFWGEKIEFFGEKRSLENYTRKVAECEIELSIWKETKKKKCKWNTSSFTHFGNGSVTAARPSNLYSFSNIQLVSNSRLAAGQLFQSVFHQLLKSKQNFASRILKTGKIPENFPR